MTPTRLQRVSKTLSFVCMDLLEQVWVDLDTGGKNPHVFPHVLGEGIARAPADSDNLRGVQENSIEEVQCRCLYRCHGLGSILV